MTPRYASTEIAVVGLGLCTPLGLAARNTVAECEAGTVRFFRTPVMDQEGESIRASMLTLLDPVGSRTERMLPMAVTALLECLGGMAAAPLHRVRMVLALPEVDSKAPVDVDVLEKALREFAAPAVQWDSVPTLRLEEGRAGFFLALKSAVSLLKSGQASLALVGAVDSMCDVESLRRLAEEDKVLGPSNPDGVIPGEGAGFVLLAQVETARRLGLSVRAIIPVVALAKEPHPFRGDSPRSAVGLAEAFKSLRQHPGMNERRTDIVLSCQPNGYFWAWEFSMAYLRNASLMPEPLHVSLVSDSLGDVGAGAGVVQLGLALAHLKRCTRAGRSAPRALLYGCSDTGQVGACIIEGGSMSKVYVNGRSVVHKGDGRTNLCATPDVCKTPSPGGPVPVPYVNSARDGDLSKGTTKVSIEGNPVAVQSSCLSTSSGDEPGTAGGGLISSKTKGKLTWGSYSPDVKFEGKGVVRFLDVTQHNGNTFNSVFIQAGGTGWAYGDDASPLQECPRCEKPKRTHRIIETPETKATAQGLAAELMSLYDPVEDKNEVLKPPARRGRPRRPYMIGVLLCKCGKKKYAAMSGEGGMTRGFEKAAKKLGFSTCGPVDFSAVLDSSGRTESRLLSNPATGIPVDMPGYNKPGVCAAQKLIQQAQREGHRPAFMTEEYFDPQGSGRVKITYRRLNSKRIRKDAIVTHVFRNGDTVPSCDTCKKLVTPMLCGNKKHPCS
ncbi:DUF4150 domain-containing protein [Archangium violaceum]|uniref:PAAR-like domain-containing protein n=1 Tax=Archangium violaceum TaxID=83451 RepID=UPI00193B7578|nr:PAAR-like domain-containing protein [Archangium violaceum]QRK12649.1 DUF4150 domain-containing protein [Archangium violaceum]